MTTTENAASLRKRVLLVDDEVSFTRLLKLSLEETKRYEVEVENSPRSAMHKAEQFKPHVVLMDVMMPSMDGGDLAAQFKANPKLRTVPIVFLTAAIKREEVASHGGQVGGCRFLAKPVDLKEVMDCLDQYWAA
jgi:CheY-like chemotaxis protein